MKEFFATRIRKVKLPTRAHSTDAGIDFYFPESITKDEFIKTCEVTGCTPKFTCDETGYIKFIELEQGEAVMLPSGIKCYIKPGYMLQFINKSGIATKRGLMIGAAVVDSGYNGEVHINLIATSKRGTIIRAGEKLAQGILIPVNSSAVIEVDEAKITELNMQVSDRGSGGFGSTN